ncbi:MAG: DegV family protein [Clostridia bacterium]|nr:DegV family protein [Clostridia bacterium]
MKTAVMTDTNSGLSVQEGLQDGVFVIPMPVTIGENCYLEGVDITHEQLYAALRAGEDVHSSQPSPGDVTDIWDYILTSGYDELIYIPMSSGLSGSCQTARQLALDYGGRVLVADNRRVSVTQYESVFEAVRMAKRGVRAEDIKRTLDTQAANSSIYIAVDSLEYLKRTGRVTEAGASIADTLDLKPILTIQGGKLDAYSKSRGMKRAEGRMIDAAAIDILHRFGRFSMNDIRIGAAGTFEDPADALAWTERLRTAFPECAVYYQPLSCSIACHVGVNAVGLGISCISER